MEFLEGYAKKKLQYFEDLAPLFAATMTMPTIDMPNEPGPDQTELNRLIWKEEIKDFVNRNRALKGNMAALFAVIWGQCSDGMKEKIKAHREYEEKLRDNDCHWTLKQIKAITLKFDDKRNGYIALLDATASYVNCCQAQFQTVGDDYVDTLRGFVDTIEQHGGTVVTNYQLVPLVLDTGAVRTVEERTMIARDRTLAAALIRGADPTRYGTLIRHLANQYANGMDEYPRDLAAAHSLIGTYESPINARVRGMTATVSPTPATTPEVSAITFAQQGATAGTNGVVHDDITCYNCQCIGHYASDCPQGSPATTGTTLTQYAYMLAQSNNAGIDPNWILLDSQSTISVFKNAAMLSNIRRSPHVLRALTNGGHQDSEMIRDFPNLGPIWYNKASIANILSLAEVRKVCRITMDTSAAAEIRVHRVDGSIMAFHEHPSGLYFLTQHRLRILAIALTLTRCSPL
jgi:hypothetical protein